MNIKELVKAFDEIEENKNISNDVIKAALAEGVEKAYRKHVNCPDVNVRMEEDSKGNFHFFQQRTVVAEVEDDEIELSLEDACAIKKDAQINDVLEEEINIDDFGRACVTVVKNIMLQKIREATKQVVYDEFIDKVDDLVYGTISTVEEKFVLIEIGKTIALMNKVEQIPNEIYKEGQRIRVIIKDVNKESKGAQVLVSRASANLVKRLFEQTVPEIFDGTVEIKAIAREPNERTKMAVYSKNANVDPIGACIGPRGQRVIDVIDEITMNNKSAVHENIDIVEWNNNFVEYVKNVMKPANVLAVVPNSENNNLLIVVEDNALSLAIGKRGINARLAAKLLGRKIDIKTQSDVEAAGIDWQNEMLAYQAKEQARVMAEEAERLQAQRAKELEALEASKAEFAKQTEEENFFEELDEVVVEEEAVVETAASVAKQQEEKEEVVKHRKPKLVKAASDYVSKFEELADAKKSDKSSEKPTTKKKKTNKEDEEELEIKEKLEELKNKDYEIKPEYTDEELEEFNNADDDHWYDDDDVDYDDYNEFYEDN